MAVGIPLSLPLRGGGTGSVSLNHYTGVLSPSPTQSGGGNGLSFGWHLFLPLTVFLFSISYSLSLLCLGLSSSSSLASSSLHLLYPLGFLSFLGLSRVPWVGTSKYLSPQLLALSNFSYQPLPLRPPKMGASRGGGRFWHSTPPAPGVGTGPLSLPFCVLNSSHLGWLLGHNYYHEKKCPVVPSG